MFGENRKKNPSSRACRTKRLRQVSKYHLKIQKMQKQWIRRSGTLNIYINIWILVSHQASHGLYAT